MRYVVIALAAIVGIFALTWLFQGQDFFLYKFWAPKYAAVQREVFTNTPSYVQGMTQELENFEAQYVQSDSSGKVMLASVILHRAAAIDQKLLPSDLQAFIQKLKDERNGQSGF